LLESQLCGVLTVLFSFFVLQQFYPINYLRNVALRQANTSHVFLSDIDFLPMSDLYDHLLKTISSMTNNKQVGICGPNHKGSELKL